MNTNSSLASKSNTYQNPGSIDTINLANLQNFALDNSSQKTNIIVIYSNIEKY